MSPIDHPIARGPEARIGEYPAETATPMAVVGEHMTEHGDEVMPAELAPSMAAAALTLARRFAEGGTLWCWAPGQPEHAQHVAVEFVHPVIVGTRSLPAVALLGDGAIDVLRPMARAGDVLLVVAGAEASLGGALRRVESWGLTTIRLGAGTLPLDAAAHHLLWLDSDSVARHDGRLVLGYHLLWELTHVCLEHPGLLAVPVSDDPICTTCSDEGRLAEVIASADDDATVRTASGTEHVSTLLVGPVQPGDLVLVHAGTAITRVDP